MIRFLSKLLLASLFVFLVGAAEPPLQLVDLRGQKYSPLVAAGKKGMLFIFISRDCPISNSFVPEMNRLSVDYGKDFAFYLVQADPDLSAMEAQKHAAAYEIKPTILLDPEQKLTRRLKAKLTPEAILLTPGGQTVYQGRINDLYAALTKKRPQATTRDLRDALDAVREGRAVMIEKTQAIGCSIPDK